AMKRAITAFLVLFIQGLGLTDAGQDEGGKQTFPVDVQRDITYSKPEGIDLKLDAYIPQGDGLFPAILVVHGGAWRSCSQLHLSPQARRFAEAGMAAFAISYRLAPSYKFPAQLEDCQAAVRWIRSHAAQYHVDPNRLGAYGYSAGGHLVALLGVM